MTMVYEGVRIIDFTHLEQGPVATQLMADFGAEVIKVEPIGIGARGRTSPPLVNGVSCFFAALNRNKKSLSLDLKKPGAKEIVLKLVEVSDVVASSFRPGVMERLGFGYEDLRKLNPRIICAYGSGYGRSGPYRDRQCQDLIAQAMGGVMALTGESGGPPSAAGTFVADYVAGVLLALAISTALAARERTGEGQEVDSCLMNAAMALHLQEASAFLNAGKLYPRPHRGNGHSGYGPLYAVYQTGDGRWLAVVGFIADEPWKRVCAALGLPSSLGEDPRYRTRAGQEEHELELQRILREAFLGLTQEEALRRLDQEGILAGPVYDYPEVFSDPQVVHSEFVVKMDHPVAGELQVLGTPVTLSKTPGSLRLPSPTLGQHNEEILGFLGYSELEMRQLREAGVVGSENVSG